MKFSLIVFTLSITIPFVAFGQVLEEILGVVELWRERLTKRLEASSELPTADTIFHP